MTPISLLILALGSLGLIGTFLTRSYAVRDRTLLILSAAQHRDVAHHIATSEATRGARHETFQLIEHALVVLALFIWVIRINHLVEWRNAILVALSLLMATNSCLDIYSRKRLIGELRDMNRLDG